MSRLIDAGLEQLTTILFKMGEVAERTISDAVKGFIESEDVSEEIRELSEILVTTTVSVEEKAFELMVKYQPVASDLRIINSYMKIAYDLERYGRYAWDICLAYQNTPRTQDCVDSQKHLEKMARKVMEMVRMSIQGLRDFDAELIKKLAETEKEVDKMYFKYLDFLADTRVSAQCMICNVLIVRYLERLADHATYLGEAIIYIATGEKVLLR